MIIRGIITSILMIALTLVSFGHQSLSPQTEAQAEAYILAGGDWAELCGDNGDPLAHVTKCVACLISQTCAAPVPDDTVRSIVAGKALTWTIADKNKVVVAPYSSQGARAPPFV